MIVAETKKIEENELKFIKHQTYIVPKSSKISKILNPLKSTQAYWIPLIWGYNMYDLRSVNNFFLESYSSAARNDQIGWN